MRDRKQQVYRTEDGKAVAVLVPMDGWDKEFVSPNPLGPQRSQGELQFSPYWKLVYDPDKLEESRDLQITVDTMRTIKILRQDEIKACILRLTN
jgi:hypothetical protein